MGGMTEEEPQVHKGRNIQRLLCGSDEAENDQGPLLLINAYVDVTVPACLSFMTPILIRLHPRVAVAARWNAGNASSARPFRFIFV